MACPFLIGAATVRRVVGKIADRLPIKGEKTLMPGDLNYPSLAQATKVWAKIAALSFGGPAGQIAVMHRILVEEKRWLGDDRFLHALNFCMILPGPEAQQLATYIGWLMHGIRGALVAGLLFIAPGFVAIMALSWVYAAFADVSLIAGLFFGLKAAVLAIVVQAVVRLGKRALKTTAMRLVAALSFAAIFLFAVPFPVIVLGAACIGMVAARIAPRIFGAKGGHSAVGAAHVADSETLLGDGMMRPPHAHNRGALIAGVVALALWALPVVGLLVIAPDGVFADIAVFFSKLAVLTFGGAYAVLAWVAQEAVGTYGWLAPHEMLDGLGMAETTPGPLIMVLQFVGFMAAFRDAGGLMPLVAATFGGVLATWVTFAPCFAWIFLGAPMMERLRQSALISGALVAVTAAVFGVILNLAVWFSIHVIWRATSVIAFGAIRVELPVLASVDWAAAGLAIAALLAVFALRFGMVAVLGLSAVAGVVLRLAGLA